MANQNFKVKKGLEVGTALTATSDGLNVTGIITATQFNGDGSGLTGVTAAGSGVVVQEEGSSVGTAATINFIGSNVTAAISGGVASVTITGGSSDVVSDTTPQLGGNLDLNSKDITGTGNISITGGFNATGVSTFQNSVTFQSHASFGDSDKINFGNDQDLQIIHNGTSSFITNTAGGLYIRNETSNSLLSLQADNGSGSLGDYVVCNSTDQSVNIKSAGSNRFAVNTTGCLFSSDVTFTGDNYNVTWDKSADSLKFVDNAKIVVGTGDDLQIYHSGTHSFIKDAGEGNLVVQSNRIDFQNAAGSAEMARFQDNGAVNLSFNGSTKFETTGVGVTVFGTTQTQQLNVSGITTFNNNVEFDASGAHIEFTPSSLGNAAYAKFWVGNSGGAHYAELRGTNAGQFIFQNASHPSGHLDLRAKNDFSVQCDGYYAILSQASGGTKIWHPASQENILNPKFETTAHGVVITGVATATSFSGSGSGLNGLTGASAGTYGASNITPVITVDSNGRITGITTVDTSGGGGGGGGISNLSEDTTPQLGGNLDLNSKDITGSGDLDYTGNLKVTGISTITGVAGFSSHVTLPDHAQIQVGSATGGDLKIYHDGSNSYVSDAGTGGLKITGSDVYIRNVSDQDMIHASSGSFVKLYHNNALRLKTTGTGVDITDTLNVAGVSTFTGASNFNNTINIADDVVANFGAGSDGRISYTSSSNRFYVRVPGGSGSLILGAGPAVRITSANGLTDRAIFTSSGAVVTGIITATTFSGSGASLTSLPSSQLTGALPAIDGSALTNLPASGITTAVSNTQVTYNFGASGNNYVITGPGYSNTVNNPDLYLVRGQRYRFINATGSSHPLRIQSDTSGTAYTDGVSGSQSGTQEFNVQHDAPSRLFYQCTIHSGMIGNIYITGGANWQMADVAESASAEIYTLNSVGIGTDNPGHLLDLYNSDGADCLRLNVNGGAGGSSKQNAIRFSVDDDVKAHMGLAIDAGRLISGSIANDFCIKGLGSNNILFATNSTEKLRITSGGSVGIGSDNPQKKLDVAGDVKILDNSPRLEFHDANAADNTACTGGFEVYDASGNRGIFMGATESASNLHFGIRNDEKMRITYDGKVGIGTETPGAVLEVFDATSNTIVNVKSGDSGAVLNLIDDSARSSIEQNGTTLKISSDTGAEHANSDIRLQVDGSTKMLIDDGGNIGINETAPYYKLHLKTNNAATSLSGGNNGAWGSDGIRIENTNTTVGSMALAHFRNYDADWHIGSKYVASNNSDLVFLAEGSEKLRIDLSGNVKIGSISNHSLAETQTPVYIAMQTDITAFDDDEGGASAGLVRLEEIGSNDNRYHGIELRNTNSGDIRFLNHDVGVANRGDLIIAMPDGDADSGLHNKIRFNSSESSIQISGKGGAVAGNTSTEHTDIYIATKTGVTAIDTGVGGELAGIIRFEDKGSNNNRYHGIEIRNRNSGDIRILNLDEGTTNKASLVFAIDDSGIREAMRITSSGETVISNNTNRFLSLDRTNASSGSGEFNVNVESNSQTSISYDDGAQIVIGTSSSPRTQAGFSEKVRINSNGHMTIGSGATDNPGDGNTTTGATIRSTGKYFFSCSNDGGHMNRGNNGYVLHARHSGNHVGGVYVHTSATSFQTSSDYRLKENVVDISDAITRIKELAPRRFNFISEPGTTVDGFIAHEAATVIPESVTGTKDEVDSNGDPVYQGIDNSKFVPLLTAALQEAITKIETLEAKIAALEG